LFPITCWRAHQSRVLNRVPWVISFLSVKVAILWEPKFLSTKLNRLLLVLLIKTHNNECSINLKNLRRWGFSLSVFIEQTSRNDLKSFSWKLNVIPLYYVCKVWLLRWDLFRHFYVNGVIKPTNNTINLFLR
jgi:hypothetical protein